MNLISKNLLVTGGAGFIGSNFIKYSIWMLSIAFIFAIISIIFWTLLGKFMRKFATNDKFIKYFNYAMSWLLLLSIITFYI